MHLLLWLGIPLVLAVLAREAWLHLVMSGVAQSAMARGHREAARRILEKVVRAPSLFGSACAPDERYRLAWLYLEARRFEEAAAECRAILSRRRHPGIEANVRRRLAEILEQSGDLAGADAERCRASELLAGAKADVETCLAQARALAEERRYAEACDLFEKGLDLLPGWNDVARAETLVRYSLALFNAGRPADAASRAEEALALKPTGSTELTAHSAAGIGFASSGNLDAAERHRRRAYELARQAGNTTQAGQYLASLAGLLHRRGKLVEAVQAAEEATRLDRGAWRMAALVEAEALREMGRFEQARAALDRARRAPAFPTAAAERHSQGTLHLAHAFLELEADRPTEALEHLEAADPGLAGDAKLLLWSLAWRARALAASGQAEAARALLPRVEAGMQEYPDDRSTRELCLGALAESAAGLGEPDAASRRWLELLDGAPDPVALPRIRRRLGECRLALGDLTGARRELQGALEPGIDSHDARRARQLLETLPE